MQVFLVSQSNTTLLRPLEFGYGKIAATRNTLNFQFINVDLDIGDVSGKLPVYVLSSSDRPFRNLQGLKKNKRTLFSNFLFMGGLGTI